MIVARQIDEIRGVVRAWHQEKQSVGVVMTMGSLHDGHLSLVQRAQSDCDRVLATLFLNPLQFGPSEDYEAYPRPEQRDLSLLSGRGCQAVFVPAVETMFPSGERHPEEARTIAHVRGITEVLCGPFRPGHFPGMVTEVLKMMNIVGADVAYFGEKDYQQYVVIRAMAEDLCLPVRVVACPTVREPDGLALSSRNAYLAPQQRAIAPQLYLTLRETARALCREGPAHAAALAAHARSRLLAAGFDAVDYVDIRDSRLAAPQPDSDVGTLRVLAAAWLGKARLIDNVPVTTEVAHP